MRNGGILLRGGLKFKVMKEKVRQLNMDLIKDKEI
jgi:hypothetical protein